jgi:hypothetical protein
MEVLQVNNTYFVTWDEYKNRMSYARIMCAVGSSVKQVREEIVNPEQDERRRQGRPHMFHVAITRKRPADAERRTKGHFYY